MNRLPSNSFSRPGVPGKLLRSACGRALLAAAAIGALCSVAPAQNPAFTGVTFSDANVTGIGVADQTVDGVGVCRRDNSDVILVGGLYYVFWAQSFDDPPAPGGVLYDWKGGYHNGVIWYATSPDGTNWTVKGEVLGLGPAGAWDDHGVFSPNVLKGKDGDYYLYYTGVQAPFVNNSTTDITEIGVARLTIDETGGTVTSATRLNGGQAVISPTFGQTDGGGVPLFDSFRCDDPALLLYDYDDDGELEYGLYYKGRAQAGSPAGTRMGLAISESPGGGFVRANADGSPVQPEGHEVMVFAYGDGVVSLSTNAGTGIWYAADGINFTESGGFSGGINAPGAYRPELTDPTYTGGVEWGISMKHTANRYLVRWQGTNLLYTEPPEPVPTVDVPVLSTDFSEATLPETGLSLDVPNPADGDITLDTANDRLVATAHNGTNMWTARNDVPMAYVAKPASSHWYVQTEVELLTPDGGFFIAGLTVYEDADGGLPEFTYALSNWPDSGARKLSLQGLGDNNPLIDAATDVNRAILRIEVQEDGAGPGIDRYTFRYDLLDGNGLRTLGIHDTSIDNARAGIYLKSRDDGQMRSAGFHSFELGTITTVTSFRILDITRNGNETILTWESSPGVTYDVQVFDPGPGIWGDLKTDIAAHSTATSTTDIVETTSEPTRLYRIQQV